MRRLLMLLAFGCILAFGGVSAAKHFWRGETLSSKEVCAKWGHDPFDVKKFKEGNDTTRAKMACSLLSSSKQFVGKDRSEIRRTLGDYDGFYFSDMFPTYLIEVAKDAKHDSWQIVFLLDRKEAVSEIIVHKNCCD